MMDALRYALYTYTAWTQEFTSFYGVIHNFAWKNFAFAL
jgi:hypothetical protein